MKKILLASLLCLTLVTVISITPQAATECKATREIGPAYTLGREQRWNMVIRSLRKDGYKPDDELMRWAEANLQRAQAFESQGFTRRRTGFFARAKEALLGKDETGVTRRRKETEPALKPAKKAKTARTAPKTAKTVKKTAKATPKKKVAKRKESAERSTRTV